MPLPGQRRRHGHRSRLGAKPKAKLGQVRNEIDITPLVGMVLILLIIFMVIMELMARGKEVSLPTTRYHTPSEDTQQPIVVIDRNRQIYVDTEAVPDLETMKKMVEEEWKVLEARNVQLGKKADERKGEGRVLIKADPQIPYGDVYPVIIALHDLGAVGIDLGTDEIKDE